MTPTEIAKLLTVHSDWLKTGEGDKPNLSYANLSYADLRYADLRYADLSYANLSYANLSYADLRYADLRSADLQGTGCCYAELGQYSVWCTPTGTRVGCQYHLNDNCLRLTHDRVAEMDSGAREWWGIYRDVVFAMIHAAHKQGWPAKKEEPVAA